MSTLQERLRDARDWQRRYNEGTKCSCLLDEAADAIDGLEKPLAWVACDERMPERPFVSSVPMCLTYGEEGIDFGFWNGERWLGSDGTTRGVTHWLQIPEPPK